MNDFFSKNISIDEEMKDIKVKRKRINKAFLITDIVLVALVFCLEPILGYVYIRSLHNQDNEETLQFVLWLIPPTFDSIFSSILVISAFYLTKIVK